MNDVVNSFDKNKLNTTKALINGFTSAPYIQKCEEKLFLKVTNLQAILSAWLPKGPCIKYQQQCLQGNEALVPYASKIDIPIRRHKIEK